jgi:hypothetical protein
MANQTNKSTQGNTGGKSTGQGSGASTKQAPDAGTLGTMGAGNSPANTGSTGSISGGNQSTFAGGNQANIGTTGTGNADAMDAAKDTAKTLVNQAKSTAGTAYEAVTDKATTKLEEQKATVAGGLTSVAESVRSMSSNLNQSPEQNPLADYTAQYADTAAQKIEQIARYFEQTDVKGMARDLESFARRNPAVVLGGAFAIGMLAARFMKSSPRHLQSGRFQTGIDHQLPATGSTSHTNTGTGLGTTPGVM